MPKQGKSHRCPPSLWPSSIQALECSQPPPNLGLNALQGMNKVLGGRLQGKPHGVRGGFWEGSGGAFGRALRDPEGSDYLSEGHLPWPVWREEAQTPQRRVNRYASEAACGDSREGLVRTAAPLGIPGTGKTPGRDNIESE